jgi:hypothetical protein
VNRREDNAGGTIDRMRADGIALKRLSEIEEVIDVPPERGGFHFSEWERQFVRDVRERHNESLELTPKQREKIKGIWQDLDRRRREDPDERPKEAANLFSSLSPEEQRKQRERAAKVRLPWEK